MPDIVFNKKTFIDFYIGLQPSETLLPAQELFPSEITNFGDIRIASGSLNLEQILCDIGLHLGEASASKFEAQVYNLIDVSNSKIQVYQIDGDDADTRQNIFYGYIGSCISNDNGGYRDIVAYDALQYFRSYNISEWWNQWRLSNPTATLQDLLEGLLEVVGLTYHVRDCDIEDLPNYDMLIYSGFTLDKKRWGDLLSDCLQLLCVCGHIDGDGELELIRFNPDYKEVKDIRGSYEHGATTYESYNTAPITGIQLMDNTGTLKYIGNLADNPYTVKSALISGKTSGELQQIAETIFAEIKDVIFRPCDVKMIVSDFSLKVGDLVQTEKGNTYILSNTFSGVGFVEQKITAKSEEYNNQVTEEESDKDFNTSAISTPQYYLSDSEEELSGGEWSDVMPVFEDGKFYWMRQKSMLPNGLYTYSEPTLANGLTEANQMSVRNSSEISQMSAEIAAKVSQEGGSVQSFGWALKADGFRIYNNEEEVFSVTAADGLTMKGNAIITGGSIEIDSSSQTNDRIKLNYNDYYMALSPSRLLFNYNDVNLVALGLGKNSQDLLFPYLQIKDRQNVTRLYFWADQTEGYTSQQLRDESGNIRFESYTIGDTVDINMRKSDGTTRQIELKSAADTASIKVGNGLEIGCDSNNRGSLSCYFDSSHNTGAVIDYNGIKTLGPNGQMTIYDNRINLVDGSKNILIFNDYMQVKNASGQETVYIDFLTGDIFLKGGIHEHAI